MAAWSFPTFFWTLLFEMTPVRKVDKIELPVMLPLLDQSALRKHDAENQRKSESEAEKIIPKEKTEVCQHLKLGRNGNFLRYFFNSV
jgi:hypothetical protein